MEGWLLLLFIYVVVCGFMVVSYVAEIFVTNEVFEVLQRTAKEKNLSVSEYVCLLALLNVD